MKSKRQHTHPLVWIRRVLALLFFLGIILLFLDSTGILHKYLGWMAKIQLLPALLSLNFIIVGVLVILTLIFGRVYCSVICPMGVLQDGISHLSGMRKGKKFRFSYTPEKKWLRYTMLALFIIALVAGATPLASLIAPYSAFGRMISSVHAKSILTAIVAVVTFLAIFLFAWTGGRTYCNSICPVGTVLGFLSRFSLLKIHIDESKCNACGLCSRKCKSSCINGKEHKVDYSRCVACMDCVDTCKHGAISYSLGKKKSGTAEGDKGRRAFLAAGTLALASSTVKAQQRKVDGGFAVIEDKKIPQRDCPIVPAGAQGLKHLAQHCTACQLCVSACPNDVLRPSTRLESLMQPESSYEKGYCRPECTVCSEVCPSGAIKKITKEEKSSIQIGHAVWIRENCLPLRDGVKCGNCARHCPVGAIKMVKSDPSQENSPRIPVIDTERCIGCGACENLCPSRPFSAIYVEGHQRHRII
ncbi:MAG: 4Fe-4S binding protein [Candidatus Cryptobacteroides sp.]